MVLTAIAVAAAGVAAVSALRAGPGPTASSDELEPGIAGTEAGNQALYGRELPEDAADAIRIYHGEAEALEAHQAREGFLTDEDSTSFFAYYGVPVSPVSPSSSDDPDLLSTHFGDPLCTVDAANKMVHIWTSSWGGTWVEPASQLGADLACRFGPDDREGPEVTLVRVPATVWNPDGCAEYDAETYAGEDAPPIWPELWWQCDSDDGTFAQTGWRDGDHTYWASCVRPPNDQAWCDAGTLRTMLLYTTSYVAGSMPTEWTPPPVDPMLRFVYGL